MPRRYADYPDAYAGWNYVSSIGSYISAFGVLVFFAVVIHAFVKEDRLQIILGERVQQHWSGHSRLHLLSTNLTSYHKLSNQKGFVKEND